MDDFEGIRQQIHSKIRDKIDENPASEEDEDHPTKASKAPGNAIQADEVNNETSPLHGGRLKSRRKAAQT